MNTLFDGPLGVQYGQAYVESGEDWGGDMDATFEGQKNGLCGAAVPGALFLVTGLHTGDVALRVEAHDTTPPSDDAWEDVVEVSFTPGSDDVTLEQFGGMGTTQLELKPGDYRVRYSARGMDAGKEADTLDDDAEPVDSYLLQFWPAPPAPDAVIKQTSEQAAYWHKNAQEKGG
jgi:hypothetical protein